MRQLNLSEPPPGLPRYLQLAESLRRAIESGQLQPGEWLPSTRQLAAQFDLHRHTVMHALAELVAEGWLHSAAGKGYQVGAGLPRYFHPPSPSPDLPVPAPSPCPYAFPSGQPDFREFPAQEYGACLRRAWKETPASDLLGYGGAGAARLTPALQEYLRRLRDLSPSPVLLTHGSQEAIYLVALHCLQPGQVVAVEDCGYEPAWAALRLAGARLVGIPVDEQGLQVEALERLLDKERVAMLYTTPLHQYPTTVTLSASRRQHLYEVATRHRLTILEDDYDHEFHYRSRPLAPLKSRDPQNLVYYVSTFSKVVYPSCRLGYLVPPPQAFPALLRLKKTLNRQGNALIPITQALWMESGGFERHLRRLRRLYQERLQALASALEEQSQKRGIPLEFRPPDGGMSLWVNFLQDSQSLARRAGQLGVQVSPGRQYSLKSLPSTHLRLGFASSTPAEIAEGIERLMIAAGRAIAPLEATGVARSPVHRVPENDDEGQENPGRAEGGPDASIHPPGLDRPKPSPAETAESLPAPED